MTRGHGGARAERVDLGCAVTLPASIASALVNLGTVWLGQGARFTPDAAETIRRAVALNSGGEVAFVGTVDPVDGRIGDVQVLARGDLSGVVSPPFFAGESSMLLHSHPAGQLLFPGEHDRATLNRLPPALGYAIVSSDALALHVVREPDATRKPAEGCPQPVAIPARGVTGGWLLVDGLLLAFDRRAQAWRALPTPRGFIGRVARRLLGRGSP